MTKNSRFYIISIVLIILIVALFLLSPQDINTIYFKNYCVDSFALIICFSIYGVQLIKKRVDIFSPMTLVSVLYIFMFFVTPIYDICREDYLWFGVDLFEYGIKGSLVALLGYICFWFANIIIIRNKKMLIGENNKTNENELHVPIFQLNGQGVKTFIIIGYIVCLIANIFYLRSVSGSSLLYFLTLGLMGTSGTATSGDFGAISMLSYALPSFCLLYFEYGKSKPIKIIAFVLMFMLQVARGFRFFILQIVVMFVAYYFLRNNKKLKFKTVIITALLSMIPVLIMTMFRNTIRGGQGMDLSLVNWEAIVDAFDSAFWENLRIYKSYYGIIKAVPNMTPYLYGKQMIIYTAIMLIPRALWKGKPGNPGTEAQRLGINQIAVMSGSAYPNLGEYYYELGIIGVVFWMIVLGRWLQSIEYKYRYNAKSNIDYMKYSTILAVLIQLIIRGYTPSNFWMLVVCMLPYWLVDRFFRKNHFE